MEIPGEEFARLAFEHTPFKIPDGTRPTLDQLGLKYGTDKASTGHNYLQYYEMFFAPLRDRYMEVMEIGIWGGASLKMWEEYFPNAKIVGLDIHDKTQYNTDRIRTLIADQNNKEQLTMIASTWNSFGIIIDDGSHVSEHQILSFETLFPHLNTGGLYIIEDLLCAYDFRWTDNPGHGVLDRIRQMVGETQMNGAIPNSYICANKKDAVLKYKADPFSEMIEWIWVGCGMVVIKKL